MTGDGVHRERQWVGWWVHLIVMAIAGGALAGVLGLDGEAQSPLILLLLAPVFGAIYLLLIPMEVEVDSEQMRVHFGHLGWPRWSFELQRIEEAEAVEFSPLRDYGGWGIRMGGGMLSVGRERSRGAELCLNQRGRRGVRFRHGSRRYLVGSDDPEGLLAALRARGIATR